MELFTGSRMGRQRYSWMYGHKSKIFRAGLELHPDFLNNGLIYITHAETFKGQQADYVISDSAKSEVQWVIAEWKMDDVNAKVFTGKHRELLRLHAPTFGHGLQDLAFIPGLKKNDPDYGLLYFGY